MGGTSGRNTNLEQPTARRGSDRSKRRRLRRMLRDHHWARPSEPGGPAWDPPDAPSRCTPPRSTQTRYWERWGALWWLPKARRGRNRGPQQSLKQVPHRRLRQARPQTALCVRCCFLSRPRAATPRSRLGCSTCSAPNSSTCARLTARLCLHRKSRVRDAPVSTRAPANACRPCQVKSGRVCPEIGSSKRHGL